MKYVTFAIMAALIFGVAAAPVFSGTAFAQEEEPKYTEKQKIEQRSDESKQQKAEQRENAEQREDPMSESEERDAPREDPKYTEKQKTEMRSDESKQRKAEQRQAEAAREAENQSEHRVHISEERRQERSAEFDEQRLQLQNRFANLPEERQQALQSKLAAMREHRGLVEQSNPSIEMFNDMTVEERKAQVQQALENRRIARELVTTDMSQEDKQRYLTELKANMFRDRMSVSPVNQMSLGVEPNEIICAEGKELVIRVSSGSPVCMRSNSVVILMDRGFVTYPE